MTGMFRKACRYRLDESNRKTQSLLLFNALECPAETQVMAKFLPGLGRKVPYENEETFSGIVNFQFLRGSLGNWFHCLLLLMHIFSKIHSQTEQTRGKSGVTLSLFETNVPCEGC